MNLTTLAKGLKTDLGVNYHLRLQYQFVVPEKERLAVQRADAVIFSSPIPSIQTATIGFTSLQNSEELDGVLSDYAYLGAPLLVTTSRSNVSLYEFRGSPVAEKIDEQPQSSAYTNGWLRERLFSKVESPQLALSYGARDLLVQDTKIALSERVNSLMNIIASDKNLDEVRCFEIAMAVLRQLSLGQTDHSNLPANLRTYTRSLAARLENTLSLANIPPESVAELYERFAVGEYTRRRGGVVYTPAWLASYLVSRLPTSAFQFGRAIDPACGSGTFLVCFLERFIEERIKSGKPTNSSALKNAVMGVDIDPVAIEASRLSLDFFCKAVGVSYPQWNLLNQDATRSPIEGEWVIGNLPFGHRTHEGREDLSTVILENIETTNKLSQGISIILPDSLAYTSGAAKVRGLLRSNYQIQEITRLPKPAFETSSANTMVVVGRKGKSPRELVVREVSNQDLQSFRVGSYVSKTYVSRFPEKLTDPWRFSPFNNEFERAERNSIVLEEVAEIRMGMQIYGSEEKVLSGVAAKGARPLLTDTTIFARWTESGLRSIPKFVGERDDVRRAGPWELFEAPKVIVRVTTEPGSYDRLAAIPDFQRIWFTDKFAGIWPQGPLSISPTALAAYFQTRFARVWFDTNNPSRKLRIKTLMQLPVPKLPTEWWKRASLLAKPNTIVRPNKFKDESTLFSTKANQRELFWFNSVVEAALGFEPSVGAAFERWIENGKL